MNRLSIIGHGKRRWFAIVVIALLGLSDALPAYCQSQQLPNEIRSGRNGTEFGRARRGRKGSQYKSHRYSAIDRSAHPGIWTVGLAAGASYNWQTRDAGYAYDRSYSGAWGANAGITGTYMVQQWLSIRGDILYTQKNYKMQRMREEQLEQNIHSDYMCHYLQLPVMADWTFGSTDIKSHIYTGAYAAAWLGGNVSRRTIFHDEDIRTPYEFTPEDNRVDGGLVGGLGVSWDITPYLRLSAEGLFYFSMSNTQRKQAVMYDTRYNNTVVVGVTTKYIF